MKLLKITTLYPRYVKDFYDSHPGLAEQPFAEQKAALEYDACGWADFWSHALATLGYDTLEVSWNVEPMQRAWARENLPGYTETMGLDEIALCQAKAFRPDVLWFDDPNTSLLRSIREQVPSIRLVLGWTGSAVPNTDAWRHMDLVLSCAPEAVQTLGNAGFRAGQLHHGFDPRINSRLQDRPKSVDFTFIGQLLRMSSFHLQREEMLKRLAATSNIAIYSPSAELGLLDNLREDLAGVVYDFAHGLKRFGVPASALGALPLIGRALRLPCRPVRPLNPALKGFLRPAVFGLDMYQVLRDSRAVLNIHADSSPRFASNMRLFETTGVGTCLVTDWKENLHELFEPDREVVVYKSVDECVEKVTWLLDHPQEREKIAAAGQRRTLEEHTFARRAVRLDEIIRKEVAWK